MSCTALLKAVLLVFGRALVCASAPAFAAPTGRADGFAWAGLGVGFGVGGSLGDLLALGDALPVALTGVAVTFPPVLAVALPPAVHPASALTSAKAAIMLVMAACRRRWTSVSMLVTTDEGTRRGPFPVRRRRTYSRTEMSDGGGRLEGWQQKGRRRLAAADR
jgi:hypothetical protein